MKSQIFTYGGGAGVGSYVIVLNNGSLQEPNAEKIRWSYDSGESLFLSIIDDTTEEALLPLTGYVDNENVLHLIGRDFDDNKTYEFVIDNTTQSVEATKIDGVTLGDGIISTESGGSGTEVIPNPEIAPGEQLEELNSIQIGNNKYTIGSGGDASKSNYYELRFGLKSLESGLDSYGALFYLTEENLDLIINEINQGLEEMQLPYTVTKETWSSVLNPLLANADQQLYIQFSKLASHVLQLSINHVCGDYDGLGSNIYIDALGGISINDVNGQLFPYNTTLTLLPSELNYGSSASASAGGGSGKLYEFKFNLSRYDKNGDALDWSIHLGTDTTKLPLSLLIYESNYERFKQVFASAWSAINPNEPAPNIDTPQQFANILNTYVNVKQESYSSTDNVVAVALITFSIMNVDKSTFQPPMSYLVDAYMDISAGLLILSGNASGIVIETFTGLIEDGEGNNHDSFYGLDIDNSCVLTEYGASASGGTVEAEPIISINMTNMDCTGISTQSQPNRTIRDLQFYCTKERWGNFVALSKQQFQVDVTYDNFGSLFMGLDLDKQNMTLGYLLMDYYNGKILPEAYLQENANTQIGNVKNKYGISDITTLTYPQMQIEVVLDCRFDDNSSHTAGGFIPAQDMTDTNYYTADTVATVKEIAGPAIGSSGGDDDRLPTPTSSNAGQEIYATSDGKYAFADVFHFTVADFENINVYFVNSPDFEAQAITAINTMINNTNSQYSTTIPNISAFNEIYGLFAYLKSDTSTAIFKSFYATLFAYMSNLGVKTSYYSMFPVNGQVSLINTNIVNGMMVVEDMVFWYQSYNPTTEQLELYKSIPLTTDGLAEVDYNGIRSSLS